MRRSNTSDANGVLVPPTVGWIAAGLTLAALWVITYSTLFPFDFVSGSSITDAAGRFRLETGPVWELRAMPANVVLFAPFGFGLAGVARWRGWSRRSVVIGCIATGGLLSTAIEMTQSLWLLRLPSLDDIVANTAGAALGALAWMWGEARICDVTGRHGDLASRWRWVLIPCGLLPLGLGLLAAAASADSTEDLDWQPGNWLVLGNEATGDRPWTGSIAEVALADRPLSTTEAGRWLDGTSLQQLVGDATLLDERFERDDPPGWEIRPEVRPGADESGSAGELDVDPTHWLQSPAPADEVSRRVATSGTFAVAIEATPATIDQYGPARIVSLSTGLFQRNLTVGQDGPDLVIRIRSGLTGPDGTAPEYAVRGFFDDLDTRRFTISYDGSSVRVTTGGEGDNHILDLQPATATMIDTFVDRTPRLHFSALGSALRDIYFAAFLFAPWCVCVGVLRGRRGFDGLMVVCVLVPIVAAEVLLARMSSPHDVRVAQIAVIGAAALALTALVGTITRRASAAPS